MAYQIDQSGKIEKTNKATVVALANRKKKTVKITAIEKQKLLAALREIELPRTNYIYKVFAALIFILIKDEAVNTLEIDKEYTGHESIIKDTLIYLYRKINQSMPEITFLSVGKKSNSHRIALATFQSKIKPTIIVKGEKVLRILYVKEKGRRSRSSRDNP